MIGVLAQLLAPLLVFIARPRLLLPLLVTALLSPWQATLAQQLGPSASVSELYIELHTGPGRGYPVFDIVERGENISIVKQRTDWVKVLTDDGHEGWVAASTIGKTLDTRGQPLAADFSQLQDAENSRDPKGHWQLGFMLGDFGGTDVISAYSNYFFTDNIALELTASENFGNFSSGQQTVISLLHQPFPRWRYSPFISLGGGVRKTNPRSSLVKTEDRSDDIIVTGAGINMKLYDRFMLRLQYNNNTVLTNRDDDIEVEEWKIGLSALL